MILRKIKKRPAFTIVEMLLSLVIMGMVFAAIALAFNASAVNYSQNEAMFKAMNTARQALLRITTDIRTVSAVAFIGTGSNDDIDNKRCSMQWKDENGIVTRDITYHFNTSSSASYNPALEENTLYLTINLGTQPGTYVLCRNVTDMSFDRPDYNPDTDPVVRKVWISMTVSVGDISQTVCTAAVVRRTLE